MIKRLKETRIEKKLSQREIASLLNITQQTYSDYETGRTNPDIATLIKISDILEVSTDYLLERSDDFGVINVYHQTDNVAALSADEQRLIDVLRKNPPHNATDWLGLYTELPLYMQEKIFAELKGMHLGYKAAQATAKKKN